MGRCLGQQAHCRSLPVVVLADPALLPVCDTLLVVVPDLFRLVVGVPAVTFGCLLVGMRLGGSSSEPVCVVGIQGAMDPSSVYISYNMATMCQDLWTVSTRAIQRVGLRYMPWVHLGGPLFLGRGAALPSS